MCVSCSLCDTNSRVGECSEESNSVIFRALCNCPKIVMFFIRYPLSPTLVDMIQYKKNLWSDCSHCFSSYCYDQSHIRDILDIECNSMQFQSTHLTTLFRSSVPISCCLVRIFFCLSYHGHSFAVIGEMKRTNK